jgi:hypothetical protein
MHELFKVEVLTREFAGDGVALLRIDFAPTFQ